MGSISMDPDEFLALCRQGDTEQAKETIQSSKFKINSKDLGGRTCLHCAIETDDLNIAADLVSYGVDVNIKDEGDMRETPLHIALRKQNLDAAKLVLNAPCLDLRECGSLREFRKLPKVQHIPGTDNAADQGTTVNNHKNDHCLFLCRPDPIHNIKSLFPQNPKQIQDAIIISSKCTFPLKEMFSCIQLEHLQNLYIPDCKLPKLPDNIFEKLQLKVLVIQNNCLKMLPHSIFAMKSLEILKLDFNNLISIPDDINELENLVQLTCDGQQLQVLPRTLGDLKQLKVLSFNNNCVENIFVVADLKSLEKLCCRSNKIDHLPKKLDSLKTLTSLDISYNPIKEIPMIMLDLIKRLTHFEYYCPELRPTHILNDKRHLVTYLEMKCFLHQASAQRTTKDANIMFIGDSSCDKTSLISALSNENGIATSEPGNKQETNITTFKLKNERESFSVSVFNFETAILDPFLKSATMDLYIVTFDLAALEVQPSSKHIQQRHLNRLKMWLEMVSELSPSQPVILVGTRADGAKNPEALWRLVEDFLEHGRERHLDNYFDCDHPYCFLCNQKGDAKRILVDKSKSKLGYVDIANIDLTPPNGYVGQQNEENGNGNVRLPHIIGYFEVNSPKLLTSRKANNSSISLLKDAMVRAVHQATLYGIPQEWITCLEKIKVKPKDVSGEPILSFAEVAKVGTGLGIPEENIPIMLQYFHSRALLVYFPVDDMLSQYVIIDPVWFISVLDMVLLDLDASMYTAQDLIQRWEDQSIEAKLSLDLPENVKYWVGKALMKLHVCVALPSITDETYYLVPNNMEVGYPNSEIWSDNPEMEERQLTVEFDLAYPTAGFFSQLVVTILRRGAERLNIVANPTPLIHCHGVLFYTALDYEFCDFCHNLCTNHKKDVEEDSEDDVLHKVFIQLMPQLTTMRLTCRGPRPCCVADEIVQFLWNHLGYKSLDGVTSLAKPFDCNGLYIVCPKCVIVKQIDPVRFPMDEVKSGSKAICNKWHNLGSWKRVITGEYRAESTPYRSLGWLPPGEHPRLPLILPPSIETSKTEWCLRSRMNFLEGFEVHFLCEYPASWHLPRAPGYKLNPIESEDMAFLKPLCTMAVYTTQAVCGGMEIPTNMPVVSGVINDLIKTCEYLKAFDPEISDPIQWFTSNRDRVLNLLTKCIANVHSPYSDLFFKAGTGLAVENVYRQPTTGITRFELGKFLRVDSNSGRFGCLRPLSIKGEVRWLCDGHFNEMRQLSS